MQHIDGGAILCAHPFHPPTGDAWLQGEVWFTNPAPGASYAVDDPVAGDCSTN